jgi:hypothetical protein
VSHAINTIPQWVYAKAPSVEGRPYLGMGVEAMKGGAKEFARDLRST